MYTILEYEFVSLFNIANLGILIILQNYDFYRSQQNTMLLSITNYYYQGQKGNSWKDIQLVVRIRKGKATQLFHFSYCIYFLISPII